ncbi:Ion channel [Saccharomonospora xinjiangensis XJ-54]|uniref:Ion channel n=1 Tax=Saccharomonospora xinjiangensis XJ-54 TaxID=882086 RepID=I0V504_9PSEU|nr:Ion channel [Saccharomonospora xinjiangensis XJ-54]
MPDSRQEEDGHRVGRRAVTVSLARATLSGAALVAGYFFVPLQDSGTATWAWFAIALTLWTVLIVRQVLAVSRSTAPRLQAIETLGVAVPLFLVVFALTYAALGQADPTAFTEPVDKTDALYFTVSVFATVGFGDIAAVSHAARVVATLQMIVGLVLVGVIAKVLVGAVSVAVRRRGGEK